MHMNDSELCYLTSVTPLLDRFYHDSFGNFAAMYIINIPSKILYRTNFSFVPMPSYSRLDATIRPELPPLYARWWASILRRSH